MQIQNSVSQRPCSAIENSRSATSSVIIAAACLYVSMLYRCVSLVLSIRTNLSVCFYSLYERVCAFGGLVFEVGRIPRSDKYWSSARRHGHLHVVYLSQSLGTSAFVFACPHGGKRTSNRNAEKVVVAALVGIQGKTR